MYKRIGSLNLLYKEGWYVVRDYNNFIDVVSRHINEITHISFDHDLADEHYHDTMYESVEAYKRHLESCKEKTGLDCARWLNQFYLENNKTLPMMFVHSMNPVGMQNIINVFK